MTEHPGDLGLAPLASLPRAEPSGGGPTGERLSSLALAWLTRSTSGVHADASGDLIEALERCWRLNLGIEASIASFPPRLLPGLFEASRTMFDQFLSDPSEPRPANVGYKLLGLAWGVRTKSVGPGRPSSTLEAGAVDAALQAQSHVRRSVEEFLRSDARRYLDPPSSPSVPSRGGRVHALTSPGSTGYAMFLDQVRRTGSELGEHAEFGAATVGATSGMYARAWAPRGSRRWLATGQPSAQPHGTDSWDQVGDWLSSLGPDEPVLLFGMPVVPAHVLLRSRGPVLNAHNGPLPALRGLDAMGWSLLRGHHPVATAHLVAAEVDRGAVLAQEKVPVLPTDTVAVRLKQAQVRVLSRAAALIADSGGVASTSSQTTGGRYYGRLHPVIRRTLDEALAASTADSQC